MVSSEEICVLMFVLSQARGPRPLRSGIRPDASSLGRFTSGARLRFGLCSGAGDYTARSIITPEPLDNSPARLKTPQIRASTADSLMTISSESPLKRDAYVHYRL